MSKRQAPWRFTGTYGPNGHPNEFFVGIPARDLDQNDIDALSSDEYEIVKVSPLYEVKAHQQRSATKSESSAAAMKEGASGDKHDTDPPLIE
jgi:hypothetical protein